MKNSSALDFLARREKLTKGEWFQIVEQRAQLIKRSLRDMTLRELGSLNVIKHMHGPADLRDATLISDTNIGISTRGIFPNDRGHGLMVKPTLRYPDAGLPAGAATYRFWGLTRDSEWIRVRVYTSLTPIVGNVADQQERIIHVEVRRDTLENVCTFCERTPQSIAHRLGEVIEQWAVQRKELYENAFGLHQEFVVQDQVLRALGSE